MASWTFSGPSYGPRHLDLVIEEQSQSIANNTTTLKWTFKSYGSSSSASLYSTYATTIKINNEQVYYIGNKAWDSYEFPAAAGSTSGTITISHNADGTKNNVSVYFYTGVYSSSTKGDYGGSINLTKIPRQADISSAPNFNDEENPTITYSNPAGNSVTSLDACISFTGSTDDISYRAISKTGTSYTFNLTTAERNTLRSNTSGNTRSVIFYVRTVIGGNTYYSTLTKTLTIVNANPSTNPTVIDTNSTTVALTGSNAKLVKYYSNAQWAHNASGQKYATITGYSLTNGSNSSTAASGTFNGVQSNSFVFKATDSRGNSTTKTLTPTMVNYVRLTSNLEVKVTVAGVATLTATGDYFNGSFGSQSNTLTFKYRYKLEGGTYSSWTTGTATKSGNTYRATPTISGLDYKKKYVFQVQVVDKLATVSSPEITARALPVFDWSGTDFNFNVPVTAPSFTQTSDRRKKEDIEYLDEPIDALYDDFKPVTYRLIDDDNHTLRWGFIAQDVLETLENAGLDNTLVSQDYKGFYSLNYLDIIAMNVYEIQKLKKRIEELEKK